MADEMDSILHFEKVTRRFGSFTAVNAVSLEVRKGETLSLLGPSGSGKTTLLRMAAGFDRPDSGRILLDGRDITGLPPELRPVNTVFQNYALFPHLSVRENIAFGPKVAKQTGANVATSVDEMLELVDLKSHASHKPSELSGGQKQRVAIARALINKPKVLLLDEPLAALDLKLRQRLLLDLDTIHDEVGITFIYVTHDQGEAMSISDRIAVMNQGEIAQIGKPEDIYESPRTAFVAAFVGDTNLLEGEIKAMDEGTLAQCKAGALGDVRITVEKPVTPGTQVHLSIRPERLMVCSQSPEFTDEENIATGVVEEIIYYGSHTRYGLRCGDLKLFADMPHRESSLRATHFQRGDIAWLKWRIGDALLLEKSRDERGSNLERSAR